MKTRRGNIFYILQNLQTGCGARGRGANLITHVHVVPRLGMNGAKPPLLLYAFMGRTETHWPLRNQKTRVSRIL
jgi:hypothetical protein